MASCHDAIGDDISQTETVPPALRFHPPRSTLREIEPVVSDEIKQAPFPPVLNLNQLGDSLDKGICKEDDSSSRNQQCKFCNCVIPTKLLKIHHSYCSKIPLEQRGEVPFPGVPHNTVQNEVTIEDAILTKNFEIPSKINFDNQRIPELKKQLKYVGLSTVGNKQMLINRLNQFHYPSNCNESQIEEDLGKENKPKEKPLGVAKPRKVGKLMKSKKPIPKIKSLSNIVDQIRMKKIIADQSKLVKRKPSNANLQPNMPELETCVEKIIEKNEEAVEEMVVEDTLMEEVQHIKIIEELLVPDSNVNDEKASDEKNGHKDSVLVKNSEALNMLQLLEDRLVDSLSNSSTSICLEGLSPKSPIARSSSISSTSSISSLKNIVTIKNMETDCLDIINEKAECGVFDQEGIASREVNKLADQGSDDDLNSCDELETPKKKYARCHICSFCGAGFKYLKGLNNHHKESHVENYKYICDSTNCNKGFVTAKQFNDHKRRAHLPKKECSFCGKKTVNEKTLENHIKIHHSPKECPFCKEVFIDNSEYKKHYRKVHEKSVKSKKACDICGKLLSSTNACNAHKETQHVETPHDQVLQYEVLIYNDTENQGTTENQGATENQENTVVYKTNKGVIERDNFITFPQYFSAGNLENGVKVLTSKNFANVVMDVNKDIFVVFYAPQCGYCKELAPTWIKLGEKYKNHKSIVIAELDATINELEDFNIDNFPAIKLFKKETNEVVDYNGEKTFEGFVKFLEGEVESMEVIAEEELKDTHSDTIYLLIPDENGVINLDENVLDALKGSE